MHRRLQLTFAASLLPALALIVAPVAGKDVRGKALDVWLAEIRPGAEELRFEEIPWRVTFRSAVRESQAQDRPILLWAMNGHPLGCT